MRNSKDCKVNCWFFRLFNKYVGIAPTCDDACMGSKSCMAPEHRKKYSNNCTGNCEQGRNCNCTEVNSEVKLDWPVEKNSVYQNGNLEGNNH